MDHTINPATTTPSRDGPAPDPRRWRALALLGTAFFMVILDSTIVLTAIPSMQADLGIPVEVVQWVLTGYALAFGGLMRMIAAAGIVLVLAGCLLLLGISAHGNPLGVLPAMFVFGAGLGAAFVACQIAALSGVREEESGLAAGLIDTSFNLGNAIGIAIATSVAVATTAAVHLAAPGIDPLVALTDGFRAAFAMTVVAAVLSLVAALVLLPRRSPVGAAE